MSSFESWASLPACRICVTAMSMDRYRRELSSLETSVLTLLSSGNDRSGIRCHFPGWDRLGIIPNLLTCLGLSGGAGNGPSIRPF